MAILQVLVNLLCPPSIGQYRQLSPLLLTLLLTIADASFLGSGCVARAWLLLNHHQLQSGLLAYDRVEFVLAPGRLEIRDGRLSLNIV
jgi:hypothetical protein